MHGLKFLHSTLERKTLSQELQVVVDPLPDGDARLRKVQFIVPQAPQVFAAIDPSDLDLMTSRPYSQAPIYPGQVIEFWLAPEQRMAAQADVGVAHTSVITEFYATAEAVG